MTNKLLIVCGPTATGKTRLALHLAKLFNGEIISADSRQVYRNMDIGTGKDLPKKSAYKKAILGTSIVGYYKIQGVKVWGYDLVDPKKEFSISHYIKDADLIVSDIYIRGKLPILVGGSGFYIKALVDGVKTVQVPRNVKLRSKIVKKSVSELFEMLATIDPAKAASMNVSDKKNPRRLIRAIEIAQWKIDHSGTYKTNSERFDTFFIGLKPNMGSLRKVIKLRVNKRIEVGFDSEVKRLLSMGIKANMQSMDTIGYRDWLEYLKGYETMEEAVKNWVNGEIKYAKRQIVWFKKDKRINWFDADNKDLKKSVELLVKKWYKKDNDQKS